MTRWVARSWGTKAASTAAISSAVMSVQSSSLRPVAATRLSHSARAWSANSWLRRSSKAPMSASFVATGLPNLLLAFVDMTSFSFSPIRLSFSAWRTLSQPSKVFHSCRSLADGVGLAGGGGVSLGCAGAADLEVNDAAGLACSGAGFGALTTFTGAAVVEVVLLRRLDMVGGE